MSEIGASEAKTHLSQLLARVRKGERFVITKHGNPVAELVPFRNRDPERIRAAIEDLKAFQKAHSLDGLSVREMIEEGRKMKAISPPSMDEFDTLIGEARQQARIAGLKPSDIKAVIDDVRSRK